MRIRDLQWKGVAAWPPEWWFSDADAGEAGCLKDVQLRSDQKLLCISIVASHLDDFRNGVILLEDPAHLERLFQKLKECIGRPLQEIGDLKIDFDSSISPRG